MAGTTNSYLQDISEERSQAYSVTRPGLHVAIYPGQLVHVHKYLGHKVHVAIYPGQLGHVTIQDIIVHVAIFRGPIVHVAIYPGQILHVSCIKGKIVTKAIYIEGSLFAWNYNIFKYIQVNFWFNHLPHKFNLLLTTKIYLLKAMTYSRCKPFS